MSVVDIVSQLTEYCSCVDVPTDSEVQEIVNLISMYTCWTNAPCESFLLGERREVVDLPPCQDCGFEFEPFYHPFDTETFTFTVVKQVGSVITETEVDGTYNRATGKFIVDTELPKCKCLQHHCDDCEPTYSLIVTYEAGYEKLPECLLPVFCNLLEVIQAKNDCDCDADCGCNNDSADNVKYAEGDVVTVQLETDIGKILVEQYKRQMSLISLCNQKDLWGFVV